MTTTPNRNKNAGKMPCQMGILKFVVPVMVVSLLLNAASGVICSAAGVAGKGVAVAG